MSAIDTPDHFVCDLLQRRESARTLRAAGRLPEFNALAGQSRAVRVTGEVLDFHRRQAATLRQAAIREAFAAVQAAALKLLAARPSRRSSAQ